MQLIICFGVPNDRRLVPVGMKADLIVGSEVLVPFHLWRHQF